MSIYFGNLTVEQMEDRLGIKLTDEERAELNACHEDKCAKVHTFNGLYYQRMVLFAALVKAHKDKAWKSWKHEDGEPCFGGGWFIVGIDTPQGGYTYHYEAKDFDLFECEELPVAKHWDGHTEKDVTRLLSLDVRPVVMGKWEFKNTDTLASKAWTCSECGRRKAFKTNFCPNCGADMRKVVEIDQVKEEEQ